MDQLEKYQTEDDNKQDVDMKNEEEKQSEKESSKELIFSHKSNSEIVILKNLPKIAPQQAEFLQ